MTALEDALTEVDLVADRFLAGRHIPGVAYGIVAGGKLVHTRGLGTLRIGENASPSADSVFRIASITKSFTAATILALRDEGSLTLDDPIATHLPDLAKLRGPTADAPAITIRHLLTMASGLATDDPWGDRQQGLDLRVFARFLRGPLTFAWTPGTRFEYSNLGYGILGRLITAVGGAEYRDVVRARLLEPLGMTGTRYLLKEVPVKRRAKGYLWRDEAYVVEPFDAYGALASMGGIYTSVRDLATWIAFFTDAYPPRDGTDAASPLSRASRREMQTGYTQLRPYIFSASLDGEPETVGAAYGYGLFIEDSSRWGRIVGHSGGYPGFGSAMRWQPSSGLGVIVLANHRYAPATPLSRELLASILASGAVPPRRLRPSSATSAARAIVERLLAAWDDDLAERVFAMNVELDEPLAVRRAAIEGLAMVHGTLRPDRELPAESESPLHTGWWLAGEKGGRVKVEVLLSPESPPRIQAFNVTSVAAPTSQLAEIASRIIGAINGPDPFAFADLTVGPDVDRPALARILRIAAARYQPVTLGPAVAGDGATTATWRVAGQDGSLELSLTRDAVTGVVTAIALRPRLVPPPEHAD